METDQKRKYYRLETDTYDPVLLKIGGQSFKVIDLSVSGLKVSMTNAKPEWLLYDTIDGVIQFPDSSEKPITIKAKVSYLDEEKLGLHFFDLPTMEEKKISNHLLQIAKNKGFW